MDRQRERLVAALVALLLTAAVVKASDGEVGRIYVDVSGSVDETVKPVLASLPEAFLRAGVRRLEIYTFADARDSLRDPLFVFDLPMVGSGPALCRVPTERERILRTAHEAYLKECEERRHDQQRRLDDDLEELLKSIESALLSIDLGMNKPSCINETIMRGLSQGGLNVVLTDGIVWGDGCMRDLASLKGLFVESDSSRTVVGLAMARGEESLAGLAERIDRLREAFPNADVVPAFTLLTAQWAPEPPPRGTTS